MKETNLSIRFFGYCNRFLEDGHKNKAFAHTVKGNPSVKDTIEALGVPHTEVDGIVVNGKSVRFHYQLKSNDKVKVFPRWGRKANGNYKHLQKKLPAHAKFVCDVHLGKLVRHLRLLGFDALYEKNFEDKKIVRLAAAQKRIVLTRDIGLLKNKVVQWGYFVRGINPDKQIREIVKEFPLSSQIRPFIRCLECNEKILRIAKTKIAHRLAPKVCRFYEEFYICKKCDKIYWKGSHHKKLNSLVSQFNKK